MTNPKLREILEAGMFSAANGLFIGEMQPIGTPATDKFIKPYIDAALAVFTQYLQEPDVVRKASMRICRETHEPLNSSKHMAMSMDISMNGELYERLAAAALNSVGGE